MPRAWCATRRSPAAGQRAPAWRSGILAAFGLVMRSSRACAVAPRLCGSSTVASAVRRAPMRRNVTLRISSSSGAPAPPAAGSRTVPPSMSSARPRQLERMRAPSSSVPAGAAASAGAAPRATGRAARTRPGISLRSMAGFSSVIRVAASVPVRSMRQVSKSTSSFGARSSTAAAAGGASSTPLNTASGPYHPQRRPSSLKRTSRPVCERISSSSAARCCGTRASASA